jgi:hypothetical protein
MSRINPVLEAQLEAVAEAHWHPATAKPPAHIPTTTSSEHQIIRREMEPWQRRIEAMERHHTRQRWLAAFLIDLAAGAFVSFWISGGAPWR